MSAPRILLVDDDARFRKILAHGLGTHGYRTDELDGTGDVHEAVIALQKADTMLQLTVQIRNKIVQAYQDVMRMPI